MEVSQQVFVQEGFIESGALGRAEMTLKLQIDRFSKILAFLFRTLDSSSSLLCNG